MNNGIYEDIYYQLKKLKKEELISLCLRLINDNQKIYFLKEGIKAYNDIMAKIEMEDAPAEQMEAIQEAKALCGLIPIENNVPDGMFVRVKPDPIEYKVIHLKPKEKTHDDK